MTARMVVTHRRYTKAEKDAYRARVAKRRRPRVWLNGRDITDLLTEFKLEPWQSYVLEQYDFVVNRDGKAFSAYHAVDLAPLIPRNGVL